MTAPKKAAVTLTDLYPWLPQARGQIAVALARVDRALAGATVGGSRVDATRADAYELLVALCDLSLASQRATHRFDNQSGGNGMIPPLNTRFQIVSGERCDTCHRPSFTSDSCAHAHYAVEGRVYRRVPCGAGARDAGLMTAPDGARRCACCGVAPGGYHHAWCDVEDCPLCPEEPLLYCGHFQRGGFHTAGVLHDAIRAARRLIRAGHMPIAPTTETTER